MSFYRLIFYHAMLGGWSAFVGWFVSELLIMRRSGDLGFLAILATAALVGAAIGAGLSLISVLTTGSLRGNELRLGFCALGGLIGGAIGGLIGNSIFLLLPFYLVLVLGWMIMGLGIGGVEGLYDRSFKKIRNGLIGGAVGGFLGGLFFPLVASIGNMSGRAIGFVILGMCIGLFIGLAQVILREAWLTVEQGFRPGRQFVLNIPVTLLGTSEKSQLSFIAYGAKGVEPIHLRIEQVDNGTFVLRDNGSRTGTFLNGQRVQEAVLKNEDLIQLGGNTVRFREMVKHVTGDGDAGRPPAPVGAVTAAPPLPQATAVVAGPPPGAALAPAPSVPHVTATPPAPKVPPPIPKPPAPPSVAVTAQPKPRPQPTPPAATSPQAPRPAARGKPCPKCQRPGTPIPGTGQHLCMSCDLKY